MKKPLGYQNTEYDSLTTTIMNAFKYLQDRSVIPLEILNAANEITLKNSEGLTEFVEWLSEYSKTQNLGVKFSVMNNSDINENTISNITQNGGAVIAKCYGNQYVLVTGIDEVNTYLFDSYYLDIDFAKEDEDYKIINDEEKYNRIVHNTRFFSQEDKSYSLTKIKECILVQKN